MSEPRNYSLKYAEAQEFYGYPSPGAALTAAAEWSNTHKDSVYHVNLNFDSDTVTYGVTVLWEDVNA